MKIKVILPAAAAAAAVLASAASAQMGGGETQRPGAAPSPQTEAPGGGGLRGPSQQEPRPGQQMERQPGAPEGTPRERVQPSPGERAGEQRQGAPDGKEQARERPPGEERKGAGGGVGIRPELSQEQRSTIRQRLSGGPRAKGLDVSISVGSRLPRGVETRPLPAAVIEIVPQYRGYYYVLVRERIVIVDPKTLEVVAVLEA